MTLTDHQLELLRDHTRTLCAPYADDHAVLAKHGLIEIGQSRFGRFSRITAKGQQYVDRKSTSSERRAAAHRGSGCKTEQLLAPGSDAGSTTSGRGVNSSSDLLGARSASYRRNAAKQAGSWAHDIADGHQPSSVPLQSKVNRSRSAARQGASPTKHGHAPSTSPRDVLNPLSTSHRRSRSATEARREAQQAATTAPSTSSVGRVRPAKEPRPAASSRQSPAPGTTSSNIVTCREKESQLTWKQVVAALRYCRRTGRFFWRITTKARKAGESAGSVRRDGYIAIKLNGINLRAHRLAWFYVYGRWPVIELDHKNGDRSDNRISNLCEVNRSQNCLNKRKARSDSRLGIAGVARTQSGKFQAVIEVKGVRTSLGTFTTAEDAHAAYLKARNKARKV